MGNPFELLQKLEGQFSGDITKNITSSSNYQGYQHDGGAGVILKVEKRCKLRRWEPGVLEHQDRFDYYDHARSKHTGSIHCNIK